MTKRKVLLAALFFELTNPLSATAAETESPEKFLKETYGWTIDKLDDEKGAFGRYRYYTCFDDRLSPPKNMEESAKRRFGIQCQTKRFPNENLGAMIFVTWANPKHAKPLTDQDMLEYAANQMAGNVKERNAEPKCTSETDDGASKKLKIYDCDMILPFGTFFASMLRFEHRDIVYYIRVQNASNTPFPNDPKKTVRSIVSDLMFASQ